jgi:hypothetical protein
MAQLCQNKPNPFRLRYRTRIYEFVAAVVQSQMTKREAIRWIARESEERISEVKNERPLCFPLDILG